MGVRFRDGEGCFSVSFHGNPHVRRTRGWQVYPCFQVSQHRESRSILGALVPFFGTGSVREKGPNSAVLVYGVFGVKELERTMVPFFQSHPLRVKQRDFELFASIVRMLRAQEHLSVAGFEQVARLAYAMNGRGKQRSRSLDDVLRGSSETVREARVT